MKISTLSYLKIVQNKIFTSHIALGIAIFLLALLYFGAARLVHSVALHPGFATPVWPSSGLALAALYVFGYSLWPGIVLGSFLHNIMVFSPSLTASNLIIPTIAALGIGLGAAAQAIVGTYLLKRVIPSPFPVDRVRHVVSFIFIALGSAIINSTIGNLTITLVNAIPWSEYFQSWWTWWIGDAAGILVFTPLILSWLFYPIKSISWRDGIKLLMIAAATALIFKISLSFSIPIVFAIIPLVIWVCFISGITGGTLYLAIITGILVTTTSLGLGQFALTTMNSSLLLLELYIGSLISLVLFLTSSLNERTESDELLKVYNRSLEQTVEKRTQDLKKRLSQLQDMQKIISDQEKLAYLGELTTGIAHEIKDPLQSINIHAIKGKELTDLLFKEIKEPTLDIIKEHFVKISDFSKQASEFAQGLIYHSKDKPGYFQMVDINELCSEYLKLASHEMYSTDPWFDVTIKKDFDPSIGLISAIPQDISVVLFNLLSNANRSVHEKKKRLGDDFQPKVTIKTQNLGNKVAIIIRDNGEGIAPSVRDKLFTPFFSTKPPGTGLGLGLSSAQEIIDKHEGEIKVDTTEGDFCEFKIILPRYRQVKLSEEF